MSAHRDALPADGELPPVEVVETVGRLQPGDIALIYLGGPGPAPAEHAPIGVIDLVDDLDELQPGDIAVLYLDSPSPGLAAGTIESITPPGRKRMTHDVAFTAPVTDDPSSTHLGLTSRLTPGSAGVLVHAYRVNTARVQRRALLAARSVTSEGTSPDVAPLSRAVPEPAIISGVIGSVAPWGPTHPGHLINYTRPAFADGSYQFPINQPSINAFITGYRVRTA